MQNNFTLYVYIIRFLKCDDARLACCNDEYAEARLLLHGFRENPKQFCQPVALDLLVEFHSNGYLSQFVPSPYARPLSLIPRSTFLLHLQDILLPGYLV